MSGCELLQFLQSLEETDLSRPVLAVVPIIDADLTAYPSKEMVYQSTHASIRPERMIGIHFPDVLIRRQLHDGTFVGPISGYKVIT